MSHLTSTAWCVVGWCSHSNDLGAPRVCWALLGVSVCVSVLVCSRLYVLSLVRFPFSWFSPVLSEPGPGVVVVFIVSVLSGPSLSWSLVHTGVVLLGSPGSAWYGVPVVLSLVVVGCCCRLGVGSFAISNVLSKYSCRGVQAHPATQRGVMSLVAFKLYLHALVAGLIVPAFDGCWSNCTCIRWLLVYLYLH